MTDDPKTDPHPHGPRPVDEDRLKADSDWLITNLEQLCEAASQRDIRHDEMVIMTALYLGFMIGKAHCPVCSVGLLARSGRLMLNRAFPDPHDRMRAIQMLHGMSPQVEPTGLDKSRPN